MFNASFSYPLKSYQFWELLEVERMLHGDKMSNFKMSFPLFNKPSQFGEHFKAIHVKEIVHNYI